MKKLALSLLGLIFTLFATTALAQVAPQQLRNFQIDETHTDSTSVDHLIPRHLYTIVVQGVDQAGNSTTATTTFRVN